MSKKTPRSRKARNPAELVLNAAERLRGRLVRGRRLPPGVMPGTLVAQAPRMEGAVRKRLIAYDAEALEERELTTLADAEGVTSAVRWINVDGLHDAELVAEIGERFGVHRLVLEDVLSSNQRAKVEEFNDYVYIVLRMLAYDPETKSVVDEQLSVVMGDDWVLTFQERVGDVFEPVRERLRESRGRIRSVGVDYLVYALLDAVVDHYFVVLEHLGDEVEAIELRLQEDFDPSLTQLIHHLKREVLLVRRAVWPVREMTSSLVRGDSELFDADTRVFLRDVYDHIVQAIDTVETVREVLSGTMDLYQSMLSNRMNEVMKVLTIIATIFIPLSFLAGLYGMNFDWMPELHVQWGYPALLTVMATVGIGMLAYFRRRGWL